MLNRHEQGTYKQLLSEMRIKILSSEKGLSHVGLYRRLHREVPKLKLRAKNTSGILRENKKKRAEEERKRAKEEQTLRAKQKEKLAEQMATLKPPKGRRESSEENGSRAAAIYQASHERALARAKV